MPINHDSPLTFCAIGSPAAVREAMNSLPAAFWGGALGTSNVSGSATRSALGGTSQQSVETGTSTPAKRAYNKRQNGRATAQNQL